MKLGDLMNFIKDYFPLLVAIIGASLAYLYGRRNNNYVNFHSKAKENLEVLLEPMYFRLKDIISIDDKYERELKLKKWLNDYTPYEVPIHKLGDKSLIEKFLKIREMFQNLSEKRLENEEEFYKGLKDLHYGLERQYWSIFNSLYKDYYWYNRILNTHFTFRVILECIRPIRNFSQFFFCISGLTMFLGLYFKVLKEFNIDDIYLIPSELIVLAISTFGISLILMMCCELFIPGKFTSLMEKKLGNNVLIIFKRLLIFFKRKFNK
ncbi:MULTISPECIES: hypothetical protein [Peribacillus]|uniref:hypothetical protein n=1 Tax=Peribacillus TaxID=2675229 RepID=UPI000BA687E6|nr:MULTISPECIES: hypothetical protein [Peribacillus]MCY9139693.1 hypothetical protein [Peribacillus frigoritolerans]PAK34469.1 hypothetical protein CHI08_25520 [Peribacillus simplex]